MKQFVQLHRYEFLNYYFVKEEAEILELSAKVFDLGDRYETILRDIDGNFKWSDPDNRDILSVFSSVRKDMIGKVIDGRYVYLIYGNTEMAIDIFIDYYKEKMKIAESYINALETTKKKIGRNNHGNFVQ